MKKTNYKYKFHKTWDSLAEFEKDNCICDITIEFINGNPFMIAHKMPIIKRRNIFFYKEPKEDTSIIITFAQTALHKGGPLRISQVSHPDSKVYPRTFLLAHR